MTARDAKVINRLGLHARAAAQLVRLANQYTSKVKLSKADQTVNAKTIMEVLMMGATQGSTITVVADGPDENEAVDAIIELIDARFNELE